MKYEKNRKIAGIDEYTIRKAAKILAIPAIIVVLIIVIIIADRRPKNSAGESGVTAPAASESVALSQNEPGSLNGPDNQTYINDFKDHGLQKDKIPEINALVEKYQLAKTTGNAKLMYEVFGRSDEDGLEEMQSRLDAEQKVYEAYQDTVCYSTKGLEENTYVVYISADIKFAGIDTPAPMLIWAYVYKNEHGEYVMKEPDALSEAEQDYVDIISASEDVVVLDSHMRTRLAQAVVSDVKLAELYSVWADVGNEAATDSDAETEALEPEIIEETFEEVELHIGSGE